MELQRISDQLRRSVYGEAWHGPSVVEALQGVTAQQAAEKPIANTHSIWELTLHIAAWADAASRRVAGEAVELTPDEDWLKVEDASEDAWLLAMENMAQSQSLLANQIDSLTDEQLNAIVPGKEYTVYCLLHGVVQHNLYHAGQIALLKKL